MRTDAMRRTLVNEPASVVAADRIDHECVIAIPWPTSIHTTSMMVCPWRPHSLGSLARRPRRPPYPLVWCPDHHLGWASLQTQVPSSKPGCVKPQRINTIERVIEPAVPSFDSAYSELNSFFPKDVMGGNFPALATRGPARPHSDRDGGAGPPCSDPYSICCKGDSVHPRRPGPCNRATTQHGPVDQGLISRTPCAFSGPPPDVGEFPLQVQKQPRL